MAETKYLDYDGLVELVAQLRAYADAKAADAGSSGDDWWDVLVAIVSSDDEPAFDLVDSGGDIASVHRYAFYGCTALASVDLPACTDVGTYAFYYCTSLASVSLPACESVGNYAFYGCTSLASVSLPACTSVGTSAFYGCTSLASVDLPACTSVGTSAFYGCTSLASADLPVCTSIGSSAFRKCTSLASLTLGADEVCTLSNINALTGTAIADGEGYIHVPADLVDEYKAASNWSDYADQITAIEE